MSGQIEQDKAVVLGKWKSAYEFLKQIGLGIYRPTVAPDGIPSRIEIGTGMNREAAWADARSRVEAESAEICTSCKEPLSAHSKGMKHCPGQHRYAFTESAEPAVFAEGVLRHCSEHLKFTATCEYCFGMNSDYAPAPAESGEKKYKHSSWEDVKRRNQPTAQPAEGERGILPQLPNETFWYDDNDVMNLVQDTEHAKRNIAHHLMLMTGNEKAALYRAVVSLTEAHRRGKGEK